MALSCKHYSSTSLPITFVKYLLILFVSLFANGISATHLNYSPTTIRCTSSFVINPSLLISSYNNRCYNQQKQKRGGLICKKEKKSMLRVVGSSNIRFIRQATVVGNTQATRTTALFLSPISFSGMTSRKRPMPPSFTTGCNDSMPTNNSALLSKLSTNNEELTPPQEEEKKYRPLVIVLAGPTAVGKSDVAAELCSSTMATDIISQGHYSTILKDTAATISITRGHVVSADSVQAYRGVDIGANKPTLEEMERTPHHLVNVVDPPTDPSKVASYNAADWMRDATYVIRSLTSSSDGGDGNESDERDMENNDALIRRESVDKALRKSLVGSTNDNQTKPIILPVVVGGTMMYLQWLVHGCPDAIRPTEEAVKRATDMINQFQQDVEDTSPTDENGAKERDSLVVGSSEKDDTNTTEEDDNNATGVAAWEAASSYVSSLGPVFKQRVEKLPGRDWYRLRRLLEVAYTISKKKATKEDNAAKSEAEILQDLTEKELYTGIRSGSLPDLGYDVRCFFLCPNDRMTHFHTVDHRCEQMVMRGLLRETASLHASGGLPEESQVTRAIGYRQALAYLNRKDAKRNDHVAFMAFMDVFATATRQYAKKQMQWFRRDAEFAFVPVKMDCDKGERVADAAEIIADMCKLDPVDFKAALSSELLASDESSGGLQLSAQTKLNNERQGKKMKTFMSKRVSLVEGSDDFLSAMA